MKVLAYEYASIDAGLITAQNAIKLRERYPEDRESARYYSLIGLHPMFPVQKGEKTYFSYEAGSRPPGRGGGMDILHEMMQMMLCRVKTSSFRIHVTPQNSDRPIPVGTLPLTILDAVTEWEMEDPRTGKKRYVDCCLTLAEDDPYHSAFNGRVGIEICVTNPVSPAKSVFLDRNGLTTFEIHPHPKWIEPDPEKCSSEMLDTLRGQMYGYFKKNPKALSVGRRHYYKELL